MRKYLLLLCATFLTFCTGNRNRYSELIKDGMKIQLILPEKAEERYAVRIFPDEKAGQMGKNFGKNMLYHADSCFYLKTGQDKQYPLYVEPVANGIAGCYEYLIYFEPDIAEGIKNYSLVYYDRYFTKKEYNIELTR